MESLSPQPEPERRKDRFAIVWAGAPLADMDAIRQEMAENERRLPNRGVTAPARRFALLRHENLAVIAAVDGLAVRKINTLAVRRPARLGRAPFRIRHQTHVAAVRVHDENLVVRAPVRSENKLLSVRRP